MRRALLLAALALALTACDRCGGSRASRDAGAPRPTGRLGTLYGTVTLAPGSTLPRWTLEQIGRQPGAPTLPADCSPPKDEDTLPVRATGNLLDGIVVSATGEREPFFAALPPMEPKDVRVAIEDCRLEPHVLVAAIGDTLVIENRTDEPFLPSTGPARVLETLLRGESRRVPLDHGGLTAIQCQFAHGCGRAELLVIPNPIATVSRRGRFEIKVPSHMPIVLHAWHPRFQETKLEVRVSTGQRREVNLVLTPLPPPAPRPPLAPRDPNEIVID